MSEPASVRTLFIERKGDPHIGRTTGGKREYEDRDLFAWGRGNVKRVMTSRKEGGNESKRGEKSGAL